MAHYYFEIKISKLVLALQSIENSPARLLEKNVSRKRSGKLLFWNKNNIKTCSNTSITKKLTGYVFRIKRGQ